MLERDAVKDRSVAPYAIHRGHPEGFLLLETDSLVFGVVRAGAAHIGPETSFSSCSRLSLARLTTPYGESRSTGHNHVVSFSVLVELAR
jgi:hypothetical protein